MAISRKYGRTYHYPFSPGTTSDDRIIVDYWKYVSAMKELVHTEKLDGENNCLSRLGVFARSHAAPTTSPWTEDLRRYWQLIKNDLGVLEVFVENLYAVHSIEYKNLDHHYYVFAVREGEHWLGWEETKFYAAMLDLPVVPEIKRMTPPHQQAVFESEVKQIVQGSGMLMPFDAASGVPVTMEGIVTRNAEGYAMEDFACNVFKYVRKGHVKTDVHWTRNWKRASLKNEGGKYVDNR
ncbi:RNA ligase [Filimonas lacunae]|uniref:RNA ligase n=1 Tax=Filimonas lacunae TaxID=477680 RepID=A0A173MR20_9BACT|nr:RNA ligase family protein [Filimonas lacunae]BAV09937.1 hypothetical protein FLA_5990 [Filimonas lacunae]SIS81375.1 RNA ligase [Filimonas lacunae]